jgi:2-succinyl-6-hydroxy-2,4-cyclohexadiene-1-carboxylate synthase
MSLHVEHWGTGDKLALLHGFTGSSGAFNHLRGALAASFRVAAPDLPGHGRSPPATGWDEAVLALADALGPEPSYIAGYSMGARLALAYALRFGERVHALVLESGSAGLADVAERDERRREDEGLAAFAEREGLEAFLERWEAHPTLASLRGLKGPLGAELRTRRRQSNVAGLASALRHLGAGAQPPLWEELSRLVPPTLLVAGERDTKFTGLAQRMACAIPRARLHLVAGVGHAPHLEAPAAYARILLDELRDFAGDPS